jgi:2-succinyl-5-enolpyruvyl-6-hydroxy-3-cyclohexene-1-carboxylate synthase
LSLDFRNLNTLWASILVETLSRLGLTHTVISPGSRSTPLTLAFATHPSIEAIPVLDERSAAFFALGIAKRTHLPVALVCTSGTAGANFYPAVIEAKESRIPLLILTADRPVELRHCHSGQTIDQTRLYGHYPNWQTEIATPEINLLPYLRQTILHAWERCLGATPGPVHLNIPFRDPLFPLANADILALEKGFDTQGFFSLPKASSFASGKSLLPDFSYSQGIIIAGVNSTASPENYSQAIAHLAKTLGFPVLAEALSPVRNYAEINPNLVSTYDLILRQPHLKANLTPEVIIQIGELPTSKELRNWLSELFCPRFIVDSSWENLDPLHSKTVHLRVNIKDLAKNAYNQINTSGDYLTYWLELDKKTQQRININLSNLLELREAKIPWLLSQYLPQQTPIFLSNSMPVRDAEFFWMPNNLRIMPYFNRGANGIDGTLSTALGIAHGNQPTILLTGDLALLHDTNGFLIKPKFQGSLTIILINNNGGGIFETLPISQFDPPFEEFFATPQNIDFSKLCQTYNVQYYCIKNWLELIKHIQILPEEGIQVLEILTDRKKDALWLQENLAKFADFT